MAKAKKTQAEDPVDTTTEETLVLTNERVTPRDLNFGRTDLNQLVEWLKDLTKAINEL